MTLAVRPSEPADAEALAGIYGHAVLHGTGTFEEAAPSPGEMERRRARTLAHGLPHLVVERDGRVLGFAYAAPFRPRAAYRFTAEDSVYVAPDAQGLGAGRRLLTEVIAECEALGLRQLVALIGDSANLGSIRLHEACGFRRAGVLPAVGHKHGRWVDVVWMNRELNGGPSTAPDGMGLSLNES